ncbi:hypothetical protein SAY86_013855 [Trapa natans]|uniref:Uncharacterized protein n=1 Tax=Trapa natans TaxID=22666 RepID=A0AAN7KS85_TRANT|nr:hypothetical protein SAY86_013855 [Trapa natans]
MLKLASKTTYISSVEKGMKKLAIGDWKTKNGDIEKNEILSEGEAIRPWYPLLRLGFTNFFLLCRDGNGLFVGQVTARSYTADYLMNNLE